MQKYKSALIYFNLVLSEYWDTSYTDEALYSIVISYILNNQIQEADNFLINNKSKFRNTEYLDKAEKNIVKAKEGLKINVFFELIK
jgi:hypothetical protein